MVHLALLKNFPICGKYFQHHGDFLFPFLVIKTVMASSTRNGEKSGLVRVGVNPHHTQLIHVFPLVI